jgi:hypothetical protein
MRYYHRHSFFPLSIILLTLALILFMFYSFSYKDNASTSRASALQVEVIDADEYRADLTYLVASFEEDLAVSADDLSKLIVTEKALRGILDLTVPSEYKTLHLELAVLMNQIQGALRRNDRNIDEQLARLELLKVQYPWLSD